MGRALSNSAPVRLSHLAAVFFFGLLALEPYAIIGLGLLVLILFPALRVAVSVVAFALGHDWVCVLITAFVLLVLLLSFAIGEAGG